MAEAQTQSLFDILWSRHVVHEEADGRTLLYVDRSVVDDVRAPQVLANIERRAIQIRRPELTLVVQDHAVPTLGAASTISAELATATRAAARTYGLRLFDIGSERQGISHVAAPESGFVLPGASYVCVDSHAPTVGGLGALGLGCGSTELEHVLATQTMWMRRPKQARIILLGGLAAGAGAKDVVLHALKTFGRELLRGMAVEFAGAAAQLSVEGRMTLCNMAVEMGARTAFVAPDERVLDWLAKRIDPADVERLRKDPSFATLRSGRHARFDIDLELDCAHLGPQITWGTNPSQVIAIDGCVPPFDDCADPEAARRACIYMGLSPDDRLAGTRIDRVFIGSCTNARFDDLAAAAAVLNGRHVAKGVRAVVVPGSRAVARTAERAGLREIFLASGFLWGEPGCALCAGGGGEKIDAGERVVSTTNRNFEGRQGAGVRTHLASPVTAAAAAIAGAICDPRPLLETAAGAKP